MDRQAKLNELLGNIYAGFERRTKEDIRNRAAIIGVTLTESQVDNILEHYMGGVWTDDIDYEERLDHLIMRESGLSESQPYFLNRIF